MQQTHNSPTTYDFAHPGHKLNKQWPVLDLVNARVAAAFGTALTEKLQIALPGFALQTTRSKYADCLNAMGRGCMVHELSISPLQGVIWFCMDTSVVSALVGRYFGGPTVVEPMEHPRELSRTELRVMRHVIDAILEGITSGWSMVTPVNATLIRPIDMDRLVNAAIEQVMVSCEMKLQIDDVELPCQLVYPFESLKPFSQRLEHEALQTSPQDVEFSKALQKELMRCELDIRGVLSETSITLGTLLELKEGDFIPLRDVQTVSFKTQQMPLFDARVGKSNGRVSASLSRWHLPAGS